MQHVGFKAAARAADPRSLRRRTGAEGLCLRPGIEVPRGVAETGRPSGGCFEQVD
jgi:hypothetical protein